MSAANTAQTKKPQDNQKVWQFQNLEILFCRCCCLLDLDLHALMRRNVIGAHMLCQGGTCRKYFNHPNLKSTCLLDHYTSHMLILGPSVKWKESARVSRPNYSMLQFRTTQDWTLHQVSETEYSLNSKPELKQAGLCICCFFPSLFTGSVIFVCFSICPEGY